MLQKCVVYQSKINFGDQHTKHWPHCVTMMDSDTTAQLDFVEQCKEQFQTIQDTTHAIATMLEGITCLEIETHTPLSEDKKELIKVLGANYITVCTQLAIFQEELDYVMHNLADLTTLIG